MLDSNSAKKLVETFHSSQKTYWPIFKKNISNVITSKETGNLLIRLFNSSQVIDIVLKPKDIVICSSHLGMDTPIAIDTIEDSFRFVSALLGTEIPNQDSNN